MRPPPKHHSCDPELVRKADEQAQRERAGWSTCRQCDTDGVWWQKSKADPNEWVSKLCADCAGYGWTYLLELARPERLSVPRMAERHDLGIG